MSKFAGNIKKKKKQTITIKQEYCTCIAAWWVPSQELKIWKLVRDIANAYEKSGDQLSKEER